jgi:hypothetical protein
MESQQMFVECPNPVCGRMYKRTEKYPNEVCDMCKAEDIEFNDKWIKN